MKKHKLLFSLLAIFAAVALVVPAAFAEEGSTTSPLVTANDQQSSAEVFQVTEEVNSSETIDSSAFFAGQSVDDASTVNGIGWFAGNIINLDGIYDYGIVAGNAIRVNGAYSNDLFIAGNTVSIENDAYIGRSLFAAVNTIQLKADIHGSAYIAGSSINIADNSTIDGDLNLSAQSITFGKNVVVNGILKYNEDTNASGLSAVQAASTETYKLEDADTATVSANNAGSIVASFCFSLFSYLLFALVFAAVCPQFFRALSEKIATNYPFKKGLADFGIGLAILVLTPFVLILSLITIIGIPLSIVAALVYGITIYTASMVTGYFIGSKILNGCSKKAIKNQRMNYFLTSAIGIAILSIIGLIPVVGTIVGTVAVCFGIGLIARGLFYKKS